MRDEETQQALHIQDLEEIRFSLNSHSPQLTLSSCDP